MNPPKERKFIECFKSTCKGSCNHCKTRSWNVGNKIYGMKKQDGKWAVCSDKKCYLEQGGKLTLFTHTEVEQNEAPLPTPIKLNMKSDHDLILMLLAKVSILEHVVEGLVKK